MINQTLQELYDRKSVRVFEDREIDAEQVDAILRASAMAPTAGNQQLYTILNVTDKKLRLALADACDHQPFIAKSKLLLVYLADCLKWYDAYLATGCQPRRPGPGDLLLAVDDALIAAQNAVVAAESMGIGSCYIGDVMENCGDIRRLLGLPEYVFPAALLVFGYPTQQQKTRRKPERVDMKHIVHENTYRRMDAGELEEMLKKNCVDADYTEWLRAFCKRKYNSDFAREMSRSVKEYLGQYE
ncbi:MAG: nitroreductase [Ruminococcaceae bacterium]|jgi:nitroreductase|nr:nitroreductase [Oscillospiraceae bacterium]